jgi:hypothetical protein
MLTRPWVPIGSTEQAHLDEAEEVAATHLGAPDDYVRRVRLAGQHRAHLADVLLLADKQPVGQERPEMPLAVHHWKRDGICWSKRRSDLAVEEKGNVAGRRARGGIAGASR